jgi:hypothetical protein
MDCCFRELELLKSDQLCWSNKKQTSSVSRRNVTCSHRDIAKKNSFIHPLTQTINVGYNRKLTVHQPVQSE